MYHNFIGIDISKANFTAAQYGHRVVQTFDNNSQGFQAFCEQYNSALPESLIILETTYR